MTSALDLGETPYFEACDDDFEFLFGVQDSRLPGNAS